MSGDILSKIMLVGGGAVIGGVFEYIIVKIMGRGQLIRDAMKYSWRLVEKARPEGAKQGVGFVRVYEDGDKKRFIEFFEELVEVFLHKYSRWCLRKK
ncbi:hypothetical protein ES702_01300 [subsurface metagenome]